VATATLSIRQDHAAAAVRPSISGTGGTGSPPVPIGFVEQDKAWCTCAGGPAGLGSCPVAPELDRKKASRSPGSSYSIEATRLGVLQRASPRSPRCTTQCTDSLSSPQTEGSFCCLPRLPDSTNARCRDCSNQHFFYRPVTSNRHLILVYRSGLLVTGW
jgi:hypothetical protein